MIFEKPWKFSMIFEKFWKFSTCVFALVQNAYFLCACNKRHSVLKWRFHFLWKKCIYTNVTQFLKQFSRWNEPHPPPGVADQPLVFIKGVRSRRIGEVSGNKMKTDTLYLCPKSFSSQIPSAKSIYVQKMIKNRLHFPNSLTALRSKDL